jgi:cytochrome P450 family 6/cytochrome P450 family 28
LFPLVDEVLIRLRTFINKEIPAKQPFDAREVCAKFTTDVVSSCIFNADAESFTKEKPAIREMGRKLMDFGTSGIQIVFILYSLFPFLMKLYKISMIPKEVENFFTDLTRQALEMREKTKINRDDYLSFLIDLQKKKNLSQLDVASHSITFFTDGFETSSLAICYTLYEV